MTAAQESIITAHAMIKSYSEWEAQLRHAAITDVKTKGLPHRKVEAWKYTGLHQLTAKSFAPLTHAATIGLHDIESLDLPDTPRLVCVNGNYQPELSTIHSHQISINSIADLRKNHPKKLQAYLNQSKSPNDIGFATTNTALFQDGLFIEIPDNTQANPVLLLFITANEEVQHMHHARNIISIGKNASVPFFEYHISVLNTEHLASYVNEIFLQPNSHCQWLRAQNLQSTQIHICETRVEQARDSQFKHIHIDYGAHLARHDLQINLNGKGSSCHVTGLYYATQKQHLDTHTTLNHNASDTNSYEYYKGLIDDHAHAVFNGRIVVHPDVVRAVTKQLNPNLLLSNHAEIDTKPQLEIYNDNVTASHSSTVGQLDENAIFYLQSRGINRKQAINMILNGFIQEIIQFIPEETWQHFVRQFICRELSE